MTTPLYESIIRVNVRNPGEFLACCGLLEIASRTATAPDPPIGFFKGNQFILSGSAFSITELLARLTSEEPAMVDANDSGDALAPFTLPILGLRLDWWRQPGGSRDPWRKTAFKLWAGQQTSLTIWTALRAATQELLASNKIVSTRPFHPPVMLSGRFGFDPGASWNALDAGFSPNEQHYEVASAPVAELLAAVGLQRVHPVPTDDRDAFEYVVWTMPFPASVVAAAASGCISDPQARRFQFRITSRGSYGCFTTATEIRRTI
jgi:hypothetical protein